MSYINSFNESVLYSYDNLRNFLSGRVAIDQILNSPKAFEQSGRSVKKTISQTIRLDKPSNRPFQDTVAILKRNVDSSQSLPEEEMSTGWKVCQFITAPFRWVLSLFFRVLSSCLGYFGCKEHRLDEWTGCLQKGIMQKIPSSEQNELDSVKTSALKQHSKAKKRAFQSVSNSHSLSKGAKKIASITQAKKIVSTINHPAKSALIVNNHRSIPISSIPDPKVRKRVITKKEVKFGHQKGICRGSSEWFLKLYLMTKDAYDDPRKHFHALGQVFALGGPQEATLLQSLSVKKGKLLGLKIGVQPEHYQGRSKVPLEKVSIRQYQNQLVSAQEMIRKLQNISFGAHLIGFPTHMTAYVKINHTLGFFFDPNEGVIEIHGVDQGKKLFERTQKYMTSPIPAEIFRDFGTRTLDLLSALEIVPVTLRTN